ncbi:MAG: hypothetical protein JWN36_387, partial [Microbacteriaceae bacterium]|nr:hypothetical protein [Microbacteriaceae bacterium]
MKRVELVESSAGNVGGPRNNDYVTTAPVLATLAALAHEKRELDARLIVAAGEFAALSDRSLD